MKEKPLGMRIGESVFCAGYLLFAAIAGIVFLGRAATDSTGFSTVCATMTLILDCGDAFHLVPRIVHNVQGAARNASQKRRRSFWLGLGNLVSSIGITVFYILLFDAIVLAPSAAAVAPLWIRAALVALAILRVALCLAPQNRWFDGKGNHTWAIYRNLPFVAMGLITIVYLVACYGAWLPALLVAASFACYLGVVLFAHERPALGMLMIPKTVCYIWLICLFLAL